jgi:hypothetical protein
MELGEPDASGRRRPVPIAESEFEIGCDTVIAAVGQEVDRAGAESEGLEINGRGIAVDPRTLATNLPGVFAGGDAVLGSDLAVRAVAAGRIAAVSIDQYLGGQPVTGPEELVAIDLRPVDDEERAAIFREIERTRRVEMPVLDPARRLTSFEEIDQGLPDELARREALRCLSCGCVKAGGCGLRRWATLYQANPYRFLGHGAARDTSHPRSSEPGKCILCDARVRIAKEGGSWGLIVGRGFDVAVAVPLRRSSSDGAPRRPPPRPVPPARSRPLRAPVTWPAARLRVAGVIGLSDSPSANVGRGVDNRPGSLSAGSVSPTDIGHGRDREPLSARGCVGLPGLTGHTARCSGGGPGLIRGASIASPPSKRRMRG